MTGSRGVQLRLALWFAVGTALLLGAVGLFGYLRLAGGLSHDLDLELRQRAQDLGGPVAASRPASLTRLAGTGFIERGESFAEVLTPSGRVVDATPTLRRTPLLSPAEAAAASRATHTYDRARAPGLDEPARLLATPFTRLGQRRVLVVGDTRENGLEVLRAVREQLLVGLPLLVLLAFGGAYAVAGVALRPVEESRRRERAFVAQASHELRTPLALLRTELELAVRRPREAPELRAAIRSAAAEVDRLERLSDDLLLLAQAGARGLPLRLEPVVVSDVVEAVAGRFAASFDVAGRRLSTAPTDAVVSVDRVLFRQALTNLVANAWEHGDGTVCIGARERGSTVEVVVTDGGPGPGPGLFEGPADRFAPGPDSSGAGLGLSIVRAVAEAHGGACGLRRAGRTTEAWLSVPAAGPGGSPDAA